MSALTLVYMLLIGLLPSFVWLWFWVREDRVHPEPRTLLAASFLGGMIAVIIAIFGEKYVATLVDDPSIRYTLWAAIEEMSKFLLVAVIALTSRYNDEPIDAMIYCITAALGFAALENMLFLLDPLSGGEIARSMITQSMRFMGATLVHVVSSATVGFFVGLMFYRGRISKIISALVGLSAATALHAAFNLSIINNETSSVLWSFGWVWGASVILIILFEEIKGLRPRLLQT